MSLTIDASSITCRSMRTEILREAIAREIMRIGLLGTRAHVALMDADDALALECLREHWRATRVTLAPMAAELGKLAGGGR
ncbi:hypothetical protein RZS28_00830 [Methylocapsa polymorpha]|uniref:GntR C-terminal domain-containing protein n=1 Tax=Methylocapsa polymorpha TaxID=3080828 RepID=A0ABZ0HRG0_9HYPH|nr:hypothetical protein RZS28_00830 [Methylocapsa sp. RX1]